MYTSSKPIYSLSAARVKNLLLVRIELVKIFEFFIWVFGEQRFQKKAIEKTIFKVRIFERGVWNFLFPWIFCSFYSTLICDLNLSYCD